jgi:uncharacterized protein YbjT (DUF2867 family)
MKVLAVFGATGQQGSSVINYVQQDKTLSQAYSIRAITRDATSDKAKSLWSDVEVVSADTNDRPSIERALQGVNTVFVMTTPSFSDNAVEEEFQKAKLIADTAVAQGVEFLIFSTLPGVTQLSNGKYTAVTAFDAKAKAEAYIRTLPLRSAFFAPASFMENLGNGSFQTPKKQDDGTWAIRMPMPSQTRIPWIAAKADIGKFVGALLTEPSEFKESRALVGAVDLYSWEEVVEKLSRHTGRKVVYEQVSLEEFRQEQAFAPDLFTDAIQFYESPGYFGPDTEELVKTDLKVPKVPLMTLDEWLASNPSLLD